MISREELKFCPQNWGLLIFQQAHYFFYGTDPLSTYLLSQQGLLSFSHGLLISLLSQ